MPFLLVGQKNVFENCSYLCVCLFGDFIFGRSSSIYVVVDGSRTMEDQDLKPNRLTCTLKVY